MSQPTVYWLTERNTQPYYSDLMSDFSDFVWRLHSGLCRLLWLIFDIIDKPIT